MVLFPITLIPIEVQIEQSNGLQECSHFLMNSSHKGIYNLAQTSVVPSFLSHGDTLHQDELELVYEVANLPNQYNAHLQKLSSSTTDNP